MIRIYLYHLPWNLDEHQTLTKHILLRHSIVQTSLIVQEYSPVFPSPTPIGLGLGID
jgi:hypothetical protein